MGEVSASGLPGEVGVLILDVPPSSRAEAAGLHRGDVVLRIEGKGVEDLRQLQRLSAESPAFGTVKVGIVRGQKEVTLELEAPL
jgi:S1-C subfamily serine protease